MSVPQVHLVATLLMAGIIVFVQIVHYPLMEHVGRDSFVRYEENHTRRTGWVVVPLMTVELGSAIWLAAMAGTSAGGPGVAYLGLALLAVIWLSTFLLQAPAHGRLLREFDASLHRRLVKTNWIRTLAWVARVPVAVSLLG